MTRPAHRSFCPPRSRRHLRIARLTLSERFRWHLYTTGERGDAALALAPAEYEARCQALAERLGV